VDPTPATDRQEDEDEPVRLQEHELRALVERNRERKHPLTHRLGFGVRARDPNGDRYLNPGEALSPERAEELENLRALALRRRLR